MKSLSLQQLTEILGNFEQGFADFEQFLAKYDRSYAHLWHFLVNLKDQYSDSTEDRKLAFAAVYGRNIFKAAKIRDLLNNLRDLLEQFIKAKTIDTTAKGQNLLAELYEKSGHSDQAAQANDNAQQLAANESEHTRYYIETEVYKARHFSGAADNLQKSKQASRLYTLCNVLKLFIEELTICPEFDS